MAVIISADEIKKSLPDYDETKSDQVHTASAKLADKEYENALKSRSEPTVILLAGGAASGKSEYVSAYLANQDVIVFDATMRSFGGAETKIRKAQKASKAVEVHLVIPESLVTAFDAFLNRDRKFPEEHFYLTHSCARKAVLEVAQNFDVLIKIVQSSYEIIDRKHVTAFDEVAISNKACLNSLPPTSILKIK